MSRKPIVKNLCTALIAIVFAALVLFIYLQPNPAWEAASSPLDGETPAVHQSAHWAYEEDEAFLVTAIVAESAAGRRIEHNPHLHGREYVAPPRVHPAPRTASLWPQPSF